MAEPDGAGGARLGEGQPLGDAAERIGRRWRDILRRGIGGRITVSRFDRY